MAVTLRSAYYSKRNHRTRLTFYVYRFYHCIVAVVNLSHTNMNEI